MKFSLLVCSLLLMGLGCTQTAPPEPSGEAPVATSPSPTTQVEEGELFSIGDFILTLPEGWTYKSFDRDGRTTINTISVSSDPWETALVISAKKLDLPSLPISSLDLGNGVTQYRTISEESAKFWDYSELGYNETYYSIQIDVVSNEPVPENLDGIWAPDPGVTREQVDDMFKTIKPIR